MNSLRSWLMFGVAVTAYVIAMLQRTSLGVASVDATDRFGIQATALSTLAVAQIAVYAGLQIPVGVLIDRVGPKFLIGTGAALMVAGQVTMAVAPTFGVALLARILVGAGDAMTFIAALRLLASWFSGRILPLTSQFLAAVGAFGQLLSAFPFSFALRSLGWAPAFLSAAALSVLVLVIVVVFVKNSNGTGLKPPQVGWRESIFRLRESLAHPGTQLGFWAHFVSQSSVSTLVLLWGIPFLSIGLGYGRGEAAALFSITVISSVVTGPVLGILTVRFPFRRSNIVLGIVVAMSIVWAVVLSWPGQPPLWLVITLLVVVAVGGPASLIGLDFARTFNPMRAMGSASGFVNVGGFLATFAIMFLIGVVLDVLDSVNGGSGVPAELYSFSAFRIAFLVQYLVVGFGVVMLLNARRRTRSRLHEDEGIEVAPLWVVLVRAWRHRGRERGSAPVE